MNIVDFNCNHIPKAMNIAMANYEEERRIVTMLPKVDKIPDLTYFAEVQLGVAAFEGDEMVGYLCPVSPWDDVFGTTGVRGTYSPLHAHGVIGEDRDRIYSRLYQAAAEKWVKAGVRSHAITLYTHDKAAINSFFYNGFGLRCIDAIRSLEDTSIKRSDVFAGNVEVEYCEVPRSEWKKLLTLNNELITHLGNSPTFMRFPPVDEETFYSNSSEDIRYFAAKLQDNYIAYVKIGNNGENFATEVRSMMNICGAYCLPKYRGVGIYQNLLSYLMTTLKEEGYTLLGVDCESFNPTARGFWLKYFTEYTHSVVRRIDEKAVQYI
jgi:GNAT superfamily N-acetyltransferase